MTFFAFRMSLAIVQDEEEEPLAAILDPQLLGFSIFSDCLYCTFETRLFLQ